MTRSLLFFTIMLLSYSVCATPIHWEWLPLGETTHEGKPDAINGYSVLEYRNAGLTENEWIAKDIVENEIAPRGGMNSRELWLFHNYATDDSGATISLPLSEASTTFSVASNSVSFIMNGDHNDGFADFYVDQLYIGQFDLYQQGFKNLVVTGLDSIAHTLRIVQLGLHHEDATKGDVAILGGAAFNTLIPASVSEPSILSLFLISFAFFVLGFSNKSRFAQNRIY